MGELLRRAQDTALAQEIARGDPVPGVALATSPAVSFPVPDPRFQPGAGMRPEATPLPALYIVASEVRSPNVDATKWRFTVSGLVKNPLSLSYADLRSLDQVDQPSTLTCISNDVGGGLTGTGIWSGVPLRTLLGLSDLVLRWLDRLRTAGAIGGAPGPERLRFGQALRDPLRYPLIGFGRVTEPEILCHLLREPAEEQVS